MRRILIIADDLTGAAEIGGIAHQHGLSASIGPFQPSVIDALIINTDSRHLSAKGAAEKLRNIFTAADPSQFDLIYKKTDSVLRGPVASEIIELMSLLKFNRSLLIPQNPSRGRVIENGQYKINGIPLHHAPFAADPEHPAQTSDVVTILNSPSAHYIRLDQPPANDGISIAEAATNDDIQTWTRHLTNPTLPAGGADFFTAILQSHGLTAKPQTPPLQNTNPTVIICGSASAYSRQFLTEIPHPLSPFPDALFDPATTTDSKIQDWSQQLQADLARQNKLIITIPQTPIPARAPHIRKVIAQAISPLLSNHPIKNLYIEGGATASAIVAQMNWKTLQVQTQISPGIVALTPTPTLTLILKPGSYPWPHPTPFQT